MQRAGETPVQSISVGFHFDPYAHQLAGIGKHESSVLFQSNPGWQRFADTPRQDKLKGFHSKPSAHSDAAKGREGA